MSEDELVEVVAARVVELLDERTRAARVAGRSELYHDPWRP